jgi:putative CocE/NonD family hydrolase
MPPADDHTAGLQSPRRLVPYERVTARPVHQDAVEHMVPMRDGVRLATDVYRPEGDPGPGPTVLIRSPYDKNGTYCFLPKCAAYFLRHGYRVVVQDVRGKFRSEGETVLFVHEAFDGYDTIEWVISQSWSDGVVGMWGDSYYGFTQLAAASTGHPALKAIVPRVTGTRLGDLPIPEPGRRTMDAETSTGRLYPTTHFQSHDTFAWTPDWSHRPLADEVEAWFETIGERSPTYDLWMPDPVELDRFPLGHPFDAPPVPMLQTVGYWDNCSPWQWDDHDLIQQRPAWAATEYLLLDAIDHENYDFTEVPITESTDHALNPAALDAMLPRYLDPAVEFFDVFLRGRGCPGDIPRVRWVVAGERRIRTASEWPPAGVETRRYHLWEGGLASCDHGDTVESSWVHDAADPVPSPVENPFAFLAAYPDERALADRSDVLSFETETLASPLLLAGPVSMRATVSHAGRSHSSKPPAPGTSRSPWATSGTGWLRVTGSDCASPPATIRSSYHRRATVGTVG